MSRSRREVTFRATGDARFPFEARVDSQRWLVRVDEFPEQPSLYTLFVNELPMEQLLEWPEAWTRPDPDDDPVERAEYEREIEHAARTHEIRPSKLVK